MKLPLFLLASAVCGILPGWNSQEQTSGNLLSLRVGSLFSFKEAIPFPFSELPFCPSRSDEVFEGENIGEILSGGTLQESPYAVRMLAPVDCAFVCEEVPSSEQRTQLKDLIEDEYRIHMELSGIPARFKFQESSLEYGAPLGAFWDQVDREPDTPVEEGRTHVLNNVFDFTIFYQESQTEDGVPRYTVIGMEVVPSSKLPEDSNRRNFDCSSSAGQLKVMDSVSFPFYYSVQWKPSSSPVYSRWERMREEAALLVNQPAIRWQSIIHSLTVVMMLSAIMALIVIRALRKDISVYNTLSLEEDVEDFGWKILHGDVFRKPAHSTILVALVGSGIQVVLMSFAVASLLIVGFLRPELMSRTIHAGVIIWSLLGFPAGYIASRLYKLFGSTNWQLTVLRTALLYPGVVFGIFVMLNSILVSTHSSAAVGFSGLVKLFFLWILVSTSGVLVGAFVGYKQDPIDLPVGVNKIPRQIPELPWYMDSVVICCLSSILPFGAAFTELYFVFFSLWHQKVHVLISFAALVLFLVVVTCAQVAVAVTYFTLLCDDYNWWWRSFFSTGASALYVLLYATFHFATQMQSSRIYTMVVYYCYSSILAFTVFVTTGAIGFLSSFLFVRKIYGTIKVE